MCVRGIADTTQRSFFECSLTKYEQHGQSHSQHLLQIIHGSLEMIFLKYESIFYILL